MGFLDDKNNEKKFELKYKPKTITGGYLDDHDLVGYCHYSNHKGYLLRKHVKDHDCLNKNCKYFEKNKDSIYFQQLELVKQRRKIAKFFELLWNKGVLSADVYFNLNKQLKDINTIEKFEEFLEQDIDIKVNIKTLVELNMSLFD